MRVFFITAAVLSFCVSNVFSEVVSEEIDHPVYGKAVVEKFYDDETVLQRKITYTTDAAFTEGSREIGEIIIYDDKGDVPSKGGFIKQKNKNSFYGDTYERVKNGSWSHYENGKLRSIVNFKGNRRHGPYTIFHENDEVSDKGQYSKGRDSGTEHVYFNNGQLHRVVEYIDNNKFNVISFFDKQGVKIDYGSFKEGNGTLAIYNLKTGVIDKTYTFEGGVAKNIETKIIKTDKGDITQKTYKSRDRSTKEIKKTLDGKLQGLQEEYRYDGLLDKTIHYSNGLKDGLETRYNHGGTLFYSETYVNGIKNEPYKFTPEGYKDQYYALDEGNYDEKERKSGQFRRYLTHREGLVASSTVDGSYERWVLTSGEYEEGNKSGTWTDFDEDGLLTNETIYSDSKNTIYQNKEYFEDTTQLKSFIKYDRAKEQGFEKEYYQNGQLHTDAAYENKKRGVFNEYHENGNIWEVGQYKGGKKIGRWKVDSVSGLILKDSIFTEEHSSLAFKKTEYDYNDGGKLTSVTTKDNFMKNEIENMYRYGDSLSKDYNAENGTLKELETSKTFTDKNGNGYMAKHGLYQLYTLKGDLKTQGYYNKGDKDGVSLNMMMVS